MVEAPGRRPGRARQARGVVQPGRAVQGAMSVLTASRLIHEGSSYSSVCRLPHICANSRTSITWTL